VERTPNSLTVATDTFCDAIVLSKFERELDKLDINTRYQPGYDTWNIPNGGSYVAPVGFCHGMTLRLRLVLHTAEGTATCLRSPRNGREAATTYGSLSTQWRWTPPRPPPTSGKTTPGRSNSARWPNAWAARLRRRHAQGLAKRLYEAFYVESAKRPKIPTDSDTFYDIAFALAANPHQPHLLDCIGIAGHPRLAGHIRTLDSLLRHQEPHPEGS